MIRLIAQFLQENNLPNTFLALQKEAQISLNTIENVDNLMSDVRNGKWESVLASIATLKLPVGKLIDLYEQVLFLPSFPSILPCKLCLIMHFAWVWKP